MRIYKWCCLQVGMPSRQPPEPSGTSGKPGERGATDRAPMGEPKVPRNGPNPHSLHEPLTSGWIFTTWRSISPPTSSVTQKKNGAGDTPSPASLRPQTAGLRAPIPQPPAGLRRGWGTSHHAQKDPGGVLAAPCRAKKHFFAPFCHSRPAGERSSYVLQARRASSAPHRRAGVRIDHDSYLEDTNFSCNVLRKIK